MKKIILAILLCGGTALAQEQPWVPPSVPSAQQCVADANRWCLINLDQHALNALSFGELGRRALEMMACSLSGAPIPHFRENPLMEDYTYIEAVYEYQQAQRMTAYIERHGLRGEFLAEDAAGKR